MTLDTYTDISSHQGWPDLQAYWDAGHRHLMLKVSEGIGYVWTPRSTSPGYAALAKQWHALGGTCGYYHWLYVNQDARAQHDWFWSWVMPVWRDGDELMTDFEDVDPSHWRSDAATLAVLREFNTLCAAHGQTCTYSGNWYLANLPLTRAYLKTQLVVMSDYSNTPPRNPYGLTYCAHQFTDKASVAGFPAPVDYNRRLIMPTTTTMEADVMTDAQYAALNAKLDGLAATLSQVRPSIAAHADLTQTWMAGYLKPTATNAATAAKALTDPAGVVARVADLGRQVADIGAAVAALQLVAASPGGTVAPDDLTALQDKVAALSAHLGLGATA